eukprot:522348_1
MAEQTLSHVDGKSLYLNQFKSEFLDCDDKMKEEEEDVISEADHDSDLSTALGTRNCATGLWCNRFPPPNMKRYQHMRKHGLSDALIQQQMNKDRLAQYWIKKFFQ